MVARLYGFRESRTNVYLIDRGGVLRYTASGQGTEEETRALAESVAQVVAVAGGS